MKLDEGKVFVVEDPSYLFVSKSPRNSFVILLLELKLGKTCFSKYLAKLSEKLCMVKMRILK